MLSVRSSLSEFEAVVARLDVIVVDDVVLFCVTDSALSITVTSSLQRYHTTLDNFRLYTGAASVEQFGNLSKKNHFVDFIHLFTFIVFYIIHLSTTHV